MSALPARPADGWPCPADSRRPGLPPRPTGLARRAGLALAAAVLLATLAAAVRLVALAGGTLPLPGWAGQAAEGPEAAAARRFYAALDAALAGQDAAPLAAVIAPGIVVHGADGAVQPGGLAARLKTLRQIAPDLRYAVEGTMSDGDRVAVRLDVASPGAARSGIGAPGGTLGSGSEVLRVADGRVVEYWPAPIELAISRRTAELTLPRQSGRVELSVVRFALRPGAAMPDLAGPLDHLLLPEQGAVSVDLTRDAMLWRGAAPRLGWEGTARDGQTLTLAPGDALLVPRNVTHTIRNPGHAPAALLGAAVLPVFALNFDNPQATGRVPPVVEVYGLTRLGVEQPAATRSGVAGTRLAVAFDACVAAVGQRLSVAWEPLLPGAAIPAHAVEGQEVVVPVAGGITYADDAPATHGNAYEVPGLAFATSRALAPELVQNGSLGARALVVRVAPVLFTGPVGNASSNSRPARGAGCGDAA